ncbi:MAG: protein kinase [Gemmatimonadaceae bacterium]|nr:protein kinase [Gemmatimonadaceae bacterium]
MSTDFQFRLQHAIDANFLIDRELGGGGMSRVFVATERALQRRVVIKVLPPELAAGVNVDRFRREIQLAAQLQHPHIVPLLSTGDEDGILWFSMPFIEGESLRGALTKAKRLPARDVVRILHDVVDALAYAHARGIVHRDIKPDNILTSGMHALVTDFGVAKALSAAIPMAGGTSTGMAIGTPAYMAPEQLAADPAADHRVDIYAVGLLAYELLTGRSPFGGSSPQATMAAQLTETPKPPHQFADIPEGLSAVIMHCLEKDAAKRPQSAQALLAELEALPPMSSGSSVAARPASPRWTRAAGVLAAIVVTLAVAQQLRKQSGGTTPRASADSLSARDAGPGGDRAPSAQIDRNAAAVSPGVKPETVVVYRNSTDSAAGIQVPVVISRAESLAITAAVRQRIADAEAAKLAARPAPAVPGAAKGVTTAPPTRVIVSAEGPLTPLDREQLLMEVGKIFADSVAIAFKRMDTAMAQAARVYRFEATRPTGRGVTPMLAPPSDGRTRVVISNFTNATGKRENSAIGRDIAQFLRAGLASDKLEVVNNETTDRASRGLGDPTSLGWGLRADYVVNGMITLRADSVVLITMFNDVRDGRYSRVSETATLANDPKKAFDASLVHVNAWIDSARVLRARRPPMGPGGSRF